MNVTDRNQSYSCAITQSPVCNKTSLNRLYNAHGLWQDFDGFDAGCGNGPEVLAANGYADTSVNIGLQGAVPSDYASVSVSIGNVVNLEAFANAAASGTVTSSVASQGLLTLTNGSLSGTDSATLSIEIKAYIPAYNAAIDLQLTDTFRLSLSGTGYVGDSLAQTSTAGGTVTAMTPGAGGGTGGGKGAVFDLAKFAASVLNTAQWNVAFLASPNSGESLTVCGLSDLTVNAVAEVPCGNGIATQCFNETEQSSLSFFDKAPSSVGACFGPTETCSGLVGRLLGA